MKLPEGYSEEILDQYLSGELEGEALEQMEVAIAADPNLASYVNLQKSLLEGIKQYGQQKLEQRIEKESQQLEAEGFFIEDETIEAYLMGQLPPEEEKSLEQLATQENKLQKRIDRDRKLLQEIEALGEVQLLDKIQSVQASLETEGFFQREKKEHPAILELEKVAEITQKIQNKPNNSRKLLYRWSAVAAIAAVFFLAGRFLLWPMLGDGQLGKDLPLLAMEESISVSVKADLSEEGFAAGPDKALLELEKGLEAYRKEAYTKAIPVLKQYVKAQPMSNYVAKVQLYLAVSYLAEREAKNAIPILLGLEQNLPDPEYKEAIEWYLAKAYWQLNEKEKSKAILEKLAAQKSPYQMIARDILE